MTLGAFVVVRDGEQTIMPVIACLQQFADQVLVIVDEASADHTQDVADESGAQVLRMPVDGSYERTLNIAAGILETDWLFYLHDDELVNHYFIDRLPIMMRSPATAWRFPHYNLWPDTLNYIVSAPYYPDAQLRLIPRAMWWDNGGWPEHVHASPAWPAVQSSCAIWHYKFLVKSRELRERRLAKWIDMYPPAASAHYRAFSVVEGLNVQTALVIERSPLQEAPLREVIHEPVD